MRVPRSTYRLQLNAGFRLTDVRDLLDYFQELGISDLYLSPLFQARPGSTHGYDVTDPGLLNPEIGNDQEFERLAHDLRRRDLGLLLDIVPNHMAATEANPWWRDVMEHGPSSRFASFFDIDWDSEAAGAGRLLLPFLGQPLEQCIASGEMRLVLREREVAIAYFDRVLPLDARSLPVLIQAIRDNLGVALPMRLHTRLEELATRAAQLPERTDTRRAAQRSEQARTLKNELADALAALPPDQVTDLKQAQILELLDRQPYLLFYWVPGGRQINYRRFFDVSDLVGLRTEATDVFQAVHQRVIPWLNLGIITGARIDHIDGLRDPAAYLRQLRAAVAETSGQQPYVVVEKILIGDEQLPADWSTSGTTGYDFLGLVNGLFIEPRGWAALGDAYQQITGIADFTELLRTRKRQVLTALFAGELRSLVTYAAALLPDAAREALEFALAEITACLPVYRTYIAVSPNEVDYGVVDEALTGARARGADATVVDWLRTLLLQPQTEQERDFVQRWQQLTGPVMAKGLEDTAFYNYHRLISTCDVGSDPRQPICSIERFHKAMRHRQADWPGTLNATSSHDTKRSEDVRARVNALSELAAQWIESVQEWRTLHAPLRTLVDDLEAPDANDELLLYQTLAGAWPAAGADDAFRERIGEFMLKAVREAKSRTSWRAQNQAYEAALTTFTRGVLAPENSEFRSGFNAIEQAISFLGALNSLSQLVLKLGAPGIPDFYQGSELWSLTLVDPDNRRKIDYAARRAALADGDLRQACANWRDGRVKALVTARGLALRNRHPDLFAEGDYQPVRAVGARDRNVIAFQRTLGERRALFVASRFYSELCKPDEWPAPRVWEDTRLCTDSGAEWSSALTGQPVQLPRNPLLADVLSEMPVAILYCKGP